MARPSGKPSQPVAYPNQYALTLIRVCNQNKEAAIKECYTLISCAVLIALDPQYNQPA